AHKKNGRAFYGRIAPPGLDRRAAGPTAGLQRKRPGAVAPGIAPPGLEPKAEPTRKTAALSAAVLPLLGSNQDSPDPESGVLPVTPRGTEWIFYGAEGDRTPDLCSAIAALSQLSYSPAGPQRTRFAPRGPKLASRTRPVKAA